jgi:hypothetical protein
MMFSYIKLNQNEIKDNEIINDLYYWLLYVKIFVIL